VYQSWARAGGVTPTAPRCLLLGVSVGRHADASRLVARRARKDHDGVNDIVIVDTATPFVGPCDKMPHVERNAVL
jgi:hypothetical protein